MNAKFDHPPLGDLISTVHPNVGRVLSDIDLLIGGGAKKEGYAGNVTHIWVGFVKSYLRGLQLAGRELADTDGFALLEMLELAKATVEPSPAYDHALTAARHAVLRSVFLAPKEAPAEASDGVRVRPVDELVKEMLDRASGDANKLDGGELPDHWTVAEAKAFTAHRMMMNRQWSAEQAARAETAGIEALARGLAPVNRVRDPAAAQQLMDGGPHIAFRPPGEDRDGFDPSTRDVRG